MGSSGSSSSSQASTQNVNNTTVQKADPYAPAQGGLNDLYSGAQAYLNSSAPTVAPINSNIQSALSMVQQQAQNPSALENAAQNTETRFLNGSAGASNPYANANYWQNDPNANGTYLQQNNPYLSGMVEAASRPIVSNFQNAIAPALASQFSAAGRTGSGANVNAFTQAAQTLGQQLGDTSANIYGNAYGQERSLMANASNADRALSSNAYQNNQNNMLQALGLAPTLQNMRYNDANNLMNAGMAQYQLNQNQLDAPLNKLNAVSNIMSTAAPYATTTAHQTGVTAGNMSGTQTPPNNRAAGALGGAMAGAQIGSSFGPYGTAIGAVGGGLMGLFG